MAVKDYPVEVSQALTSFKARREAVRRDPDLNEDGRQKRLAALKTEEAAYRQTAHTKLSAVWSSLRREYEDLQAREAAAEDQAAQGWDYARLAYERDQVRVVLKMVRGDGMGDGWEAARAAYERGASSGDLHKQRAYLENGGEVLASRFSAIHGGEISGLEKAARTRLDEISTTDDLKAVREAGADLVRRAREAAQVTRLAENYFVKGGGAFGGGEFLQLLEGISLTDRFTDGLNTVTTLEFQPVEGGA